MADVQTENGYTRIANELFDKIIQANFNKREIKIILTVIRYTYGFNRKQTSLSIRFISQATGIAYPNLSATLLKLARQNVIKFESDFNTNHTSRTISLNKNFDLWMFPGDNQNNSYQINNSYQNDNRTVIKPITETVIKTITKKEIKENIKKRNLPFSEIEIPETLKNIPGFLDTWKAWLSYRKELKKELTPASQKMQLKNLMQWNNAGHDVIRIINNSIRNGWQGLFEPKKNIPVKPKPKKEQTDLREFMRNNPGWGYDA